MVVVAVEEDVEAAAEDVAAVALHHRKFFSHFIHFK